ncbi:zinc/cadmium/mercury/lead-transporting ATPase [compost metagenome]
MKIFVLLTSMLFSVSAFATETTYDVEGMHCSSCAKSIKAQVCKMDGLEKCDVTVGKVVVAPKSGFNISKEQIQQAISKAGEYKIIGEKSDK